MGASSNGKSGSCIFPICTIRVQNCVKNAARQNLPFYFSEQEQTQCFNWYKPFLPFQAARFSPKSARKMPKIARLFISPANTGIWNFNYLFLPRSNILNPLTNENLNTKPGYSPCYIIQLLHCEITFMVTVQAANN